MDGLQEGHVDIISAPLNISSCIDQKKNINKIGYSFSLIKMKQDSFKCKLKNK